MTEPRFVDAPVEFRDGKWWTKPHEVYLGELLVCENDPNCRCHSMPEFFKTRPEVETKTVTVANVYDILRWLEAVFPDRIKFSDKTKLAEGYIEQYNKYQPQERVY